MPLFLIKGEYRIVGARPDGDSIKFYPDNPDLWDKLGRVKRNRSGGAQLRLDAIDALETHYRPPVSRGGEERQPLQYAEAASDALLKSLGFTEFSRSSDETIASATPESVRGYILSRFADKYGRAVAFAFAGESDEQDGDGVFLDTNLLGESANYQLLAAGLVYPTFYSKLYADLRRELTQAAQAARNDGLGLWPSDRTNSGFSLDSLATITDEVVILPKLFRRLVEYIELNNGEPGLEGFKSFLEAQADEVTVLPEGRFTHFDSLITVSGQQLQLDEPPENLVFREG
ncbi:thermonuclease family protein [Gloeobacter kilaueensis]|uniref:TNase-like domain-containing protein n=1 Tax=Gloeobacter kilaueensis (strain ATCC BAA-2537 / CCAP 1431/1 / ULC 316 / JS1) TaxID=1183438 RepID=U5QDY4_GLOK1|nr:thermonuclease family protein [Gloeobacter kilaueensis]AGY57083.1 hypothetical protein GKIL_0837 [Gloeobacter kilaueensis JS1]